MTKKVIYISFVRLSDKTSRERYVDYLLAKGVRVEFWDVVALVREEYEEAAAKTTDYLHTFRTYREVEEMLRIPENKDAHYVMLVSYAGFTVRLFRLMSKYKCKMLYITSGSVPNKPMNRWRRLLLGYSNPRQLAAHFYYRVKAIIYRKLKLVKQFDIVFAAGQTLLANSSYATKVVPINCADYDQYRKIKLENAAPIVEGHYAVFLDIYLPYHSDLKVAGWPTVRSNEYYASLSRFFDLLEAKYKIKVVIAAHPRADYRVSNPYNEREIYHGQTPMLVKGADFVISHSSMSQSQAILNHKPLVFIYTNEMLSAYKHTLMNEIFDAAEYLDAAIYNVDEITNSSQITIKEVNPICYENYKYSFLTTRESEHMTTAEIFWHAIETS